MRKIIHADNRFIIFMMFIIATLALIMIGCGEESEITPPPQPRPVQIGVLLALSGPDSTIGLSCQAGVEVAVETANDYLEQNGSDYVVEAIYRDTHSDPDLALSALEELSGTGAEIILGPTGDREVSTALLDYAAQRSIILVSPASGSISLAVPDDNLLRFSLNDRFQAEAIANRIWGDGMEGVIPVARNDEWADSLLAVFEQQYLSLGGDVHDALRYDPEAADFSSLMQQLEDMIPELPEYPDSTLAVFFAGNDNEVSQAFTAAASRYFVRRVNWYGTEKNARSVMLSSSNLAAVATDVGGFICPRYGEVENEEYQKIKDKIDLKLGAESSPYAVAAYDAFTVIFKAYEKMNYYVLNYSEMLDSLTATADEYDGATGPTALDDAGDRRFGTLDFWSIILTDPGNMVYEWLKYSSESFLPGGD